MTLRRFKEKLLALPKQKSGCMHWHDRRTYGQVWINKVKYQAHRVAHTAFNGKIEEGFVILHKCDNPPCVNPEHLSAGTQAENMQDMVSKGRARLADVYYKKASLSKLGRMGMMDKLEEVITSAEASFTITFSKLGGWIARLGPVNILNPWTKSAFGMRKHCIHVTKFFARHGFYPGHNEKGLEKKRYFRELAAA